MFFVQINHTGKGFLFLIFREIKLRKYSSLHKIFYGLVVASPINIVIFVLFLVGTIYIVNSFKKQYYQLILNVIIGLEVIPAFLLRGQLLYIVAAIILAVLIIIKQVRLSKNMRSSNNNQL